MRNYSAVAWSREQTSRGGRRGGAFGGYTWKRSAGGSVDTLLRRRAVEHERPNSLPLQSTCSSCLPSPRSARRSPPRSRPLDRRGLASWPSDQPTGFAVRMSQHCAKHVAHIGTARLFSRLLTTECDNFPGMTERNTAERFWSLVSGPPSSCWEWPRCKTSRGYGSFSWENEQWLSHRLAYTLKYGRIPPGSVVRHKCDNPPCCNPEHLELGSMRDNMLDCVSRGRKNAAKGNSLPVSKLTPQAVSSIRAARSAGASLRELATQHGVTPATIQKVWSRATWKHVQD